jgi:hypothetical protein
MEINVEKTKVMSFQGKEPVRSKLYTNRKVLEQVNTFNYLGCKISYEGEWDLNMKITNFVNVVEIIN